MIFTANWISSENFLLFQKLDLIKKKREIGKLFFNRKNISKPTKSMTVLIIVKWKIIVKLFRIQINLINLH